MDDTTLFTLAEFLSSEAGDDETAGKLETSETSVEAGTATSAADTCSVSIFNLRIAFDGILLKLLINS